MSIATIETDAASVTLAPDGGYHLLMATAAGCVRFHVPLAAGCAIFRITNPAAIQADESKTGRVNKSRTLAEREALYREIRQIQLSPRYLRGAVAAACRERGIESEAYYAWAAKQPNA